MAGSEREASLAGLYREPSRDCRAGRAGDAAPPGQAVAGLRPERTRRAGGPWRWWTRPKRCSASSKVRDRGADWAINLLLWDRPADLPGLPWGFLGSRTPQKASFWAGTLPQTGNLERDEWLRDWESLGSVCPLRLDLGFPNWPPTLNFLGDGFPSVLGSLKPFGSCSLSEW